MLPISACSNLSPDPSPDLVGYSIVEQLYVGTRTVVYRAVQQSSQQPVIIKLLQPDYPSFNDLLQFRNQYTITKNLDIPGIVRPYSLESYRNSYALVMEDFGGVSLRDYTQAQSLSWPEVLHIALQLSQILHHLHSHRIIHKDIKPAHILFHPETQEIRLIDFSIASLLPKATQEIKNPQRLEGTLAYLAPEQTGRMNRGVDYRADFYALGVTLYELLTAELPFQTDDPLELVHCHIAKVPNLAHQVNSNVPPIISEIVAKLLAKNAADRYQSALGLQYDLQTCLAQWQTSGAIQPFALGRQDCSERFLIPETLYGREQEVQALLAAFDRVSYGSSELLLIAGFSGIGKTAVVNEVYKPILRRRGYFIKGKFEQFNRDIPFSALVQAFRDWVGQVLSESDAQLQNWRTKLLESLGEHGQVLIDVVPELEQIIGPQSAVPELIESATQKRFNLLLQKFLQVLTTAEHPLVMFLDDLQWADSASLQLLKQLMNDSSYLLLLAAYRDNEVSPAHPLMAMVKELKQAGATVNTITLAPLTLQDTNRLVADTLHCSAEHAQPLAELIDRKTQGNPFFTTQFLKALYKEGHITFNREQRYWECDMTQVNALSLTDDVVDFMAQRLPLSATETLFATEPLSRLPLAGTQSDASGGISDSDSLDLASVLKASQTLSSEIEFDQLLTTLLHTALENAGADKGALILPREDQWYVEAIASLNHSAQVQSILLPDSHEVPHSLINSVKRSLKPVVVIDAVIYPALTTDAYVVRQQPKSMLCTPLLQRGELVAILYLENQATVGAFTNNRVEVLNLLCTQAAISLENARLYSRVQDSQRQLATLLGNLPGMAYSCANDADWTMKFVSEGCFSLTGYRPDDLIHNRCISYGALICPDYVELVNIAVQTALAERRPFQITYQIQTKTGAVKWVWEQGCGVFDANGNFLSIEGLILDISDRKAAEAIILQKSQALEQALQDLQNTQLQLVQNEKMASLGNLVAGVAHEVNNPLGFLNGSINNAKDYVQGLLSHLQLYQQHYPQTGLLQDHAEQIDLDFLATDLPKLLDSMQAAIDRIKTISTSLRTFSRADTEHRVKADLHEGIDSALLILKYRLKANKHRPAIQIIQDYGELPPIECFPGQLNQVFMNIIANAIDMFDELAQQFSFAELEAKPQTITIQTRILTNQNAVEICIRDNGKGMTEAVKTRIFDHLFTTKSVGQGTGLGLAIARQIVTETHAGSIEVQSELGQGSEFCIRLPISGG